MKYSCCALSITADCCGGAAALRSSRRVVDQATSSSDLMKVATPRSTTTTTISGDDDEGVGEQLSQNLTTAGGYYLSARESAAIVSGGSLELPFEIPRGNNPLLDPVCEESFDAELLFVEKVGLAHTALLAIRRGAEGKLREALDQLSFQQPEVSYRHFIDSLIKKRFPNSRYWWKVELWLLTPAGHSHGTGSKPPLDIHQAIALQKHMMSLQKRLAMRWNRPRIHETSVFIPSFLAKIDLKEADRIIRTPNFVTLSLETIFCLLLSNQPPPPSHNTENIVQREQQQQQQRVAQGVEEQEEERQGQAFEEEHHPDHHHHEEDRSMAGKKEALAVASTI